MTESTTQEVRASVAIRYWMRKRNFTAEQLSAATGIPLRTLGRRLSPKTPHGLLVDELLLIADALDVSPAALLGESPRKRAEQRSS